MARAGGNGGHGGNRHSFDSEVVNMIKRIPRNQFKTRLDALEQQMEKPEMSIKQMEQRLNDYCTQHGIKDNTGTVFCDFVEADEHAPKFVREYAAAVRSLRAEFPELD